MRKMFVLCSLGLLVAWASSAEATGPVRGDSIYLFNTGATLQGNWALFPNTDSAGATPGGLLPADSITYFNDIALTPNPNTPMVGDVNGDGVADIVTHGKNANNDTIMLGRNTDVFTSGGVSWGSLNLPPLGPAAWQPAPDGNWSPFWNPTPDADYTDYFLADVDGDGKDDAVAVRPTPWDGGATTYFVAQHSDAEGLEGHAPVTTWDAGRLNPHALWKPIMGDFNGDGAVDAAQQGSAASPNPALVHGMVSIPGTGLDTTSTSPTYWGGMGFATNHLATLVGDINGDGMDDIVQVDDRNSNGSWTWVAGITGVNGAIPAGVEIAQGGAHSWAAPFSLDVNSLAAYPLLADMDNDGRDDLVLFEEYDDGSGNIWARILVSMTDDPAGGLFTNAFDYGAGWYDYTALTGVNEGGFIPMVGNVHPLVAVVLGDMDGDGDFDVDDIDDMVLYLEDPVAYGSANPGLDPVARGDFNGDLSTDTGDLAGFIPVLNGLPNPIAPGTDTAAVPEPTSLVLLGLGLLGLVGYGWRKRRM